MRRSSFLLAAIASLVLAPGALAGERAVAADGARATAGAAAASLRVRLDGGLLDRGRRYVVKRQRVRVEGAVDAYAPGQRVVVDLLRGGRLVHRSTAAVTPSGGGGRFEARVTANVKGSYAVDAHLDAADGTRAAAAPPARFRALSP
nr:hypothetical protein [Actinomycetota bacterium]